jgi:hypothetical protein
MEAPNELLKATPAELNMAEWCGAWSEHPSRRGHYSQIDTHGQFQGRYVRIVGWESATGRYLLRTVARA